MAERMFYPPGSTYNELAGYKGNLDLQQRVNLKLLKSRIRESGVDLHANRCKHPDEDRDAFLLRFLRARDFHVENARKLLLEDVKWREEFGIDELMSQSCEQILGCDPTEVNNRYPHWTHGVDKFGRPAMFEKSYMCDIDGALEHTTHEALVRYHVWRAEHNTEKLRSQTKATGYQVDTLISVVDIDNMRIGQVTRKFLALVQEIAKIDQDHYPERLGQLFIINTPGLFGFVWSGVKPWLSARTLDKIKILTSSQVNEELQKFFYPEQLPEEYGGTCCCEGGCLPELYNPDVEIEMAAAAAAEAEITARGHRRNQSTDSVNSISFHDAHSQMSQFETFGEDSDDEQLTPEEAAQLELTRVEFRQTQTHFRYWNVTPYAFGLMLIFLASYARAKLWYKHGTEWTAWCVAMSLCLGLLLVLTGLLGHYGLHSSSPPVLTWYSRFVFFWSMQVLILGIALLAVNDQVGDTLNDEVATNRVSAEEIQTFSIAFGSCSVTAGLLMMVPCFVASNLATKISCLPDPIDEYDMVRTLMRLFSSVSLLMALCATGLGYACSLLAMYTSNYVFGMFVFTLGSVIVALHSILGFFVSAASKTPKTLVLIKCGRYFCYLIVLGLVVFIVVTGASYGAIDDVRNNWATTSQDLVNSPWNGSTLNEIISTLQWNRIFVLGCSIMMFSLAIASAVLWGTYNAYVSANVVVPQDEDGVCTEQPLTSWQKSVVVWACVAACFQLFWNGQYLMFNYWVSHESTSENSSEFWFVSSWLLMGDADNRYSNRDDTIYVIELFTVGIAMPFSLALAFATYANRPARHVLGIMACFLQIYHAMIYFATEASAGFRHTASVNSSKFWLIFVLVTFLRFLVPIPIFVSSWKHLVRAVHVHDTHNPSIRRKSPQEDEDDKTFLEMDVKNRSIEQTLEAPFNNHTLAKTPTAASMEPIDEHTPMATPIAAPLTPSQEIVDMELGNLSDFSAGEDDLEAA